MLEDDLVTICMPVFNGARYVQSSVTSLLAQTHRNLEVIVVDDGSTDTTLEILHSFQDSRLKIIENDENRGNLVRRNQAFDVASGAYIAIMDADDVCRADRVARQVACLKAGYALSGSFVANGRSPAFVKTVWRLPQQGHELVRSALFGSPMANPSVMMTRELFEEQAFRFDVDMFPAADYDAWSRLIFTERVPTFIVPAPLIFRRIHEASISHQKAKLMAQQADKVRRRLLGKLDVPSELIDLHNKALATPVDKAEVDELHRLHQDVLRQAMPDVFGSGSVNYRQNNLRIPLAPTSSSSGSQSPSKKVSVIVPAYNVGALLNECVDSVAGTSSEAVEVIIVDDGSTDDTPKVCAALGEKYGDKVRVVRQKNGGLSAARNAGVGQSSAEYVFFLDGDDFMAPGAIDELYELAQRTQADVVVSTHSAYFEDTKKTEPRHEVTETKTYTADVFDHFANRTFGYIAANKLIKRHLVEEVPFYKGIYHEDELFCPELFLRAKRVSTLAKELYYYRQRSGSITSTVTEKHIRDWVFIAERVMNLGFQFGLSTQSSVGFSKLMAYLLLAARNKLSKLETCPETFANEIHAAASLLEARLVNICGIHDPHAATTRTQDTPHKTDPKVVRSQWRELRKLQDTLAQLMQAMDAPQKIGSEAYKPVNRSDTARTR